MHSLWSCKVIKNLWIDLMPKLTNLLVLCRDDWCTAEAWDEMVKLLDEHEPEEAALILWNVCESVNI